MNVKVFLVTIFCLGLLNACKKEGEFGRELEPDESGYYLTLKRPGRSYVWNGRNGNSEPYSFDAYFNSGRGELLLNVSPAASGSSDLINFNMTIRTQNVGGNYTISPDGRNGNSFRFLHGSSTYNLKVPAEGSNLKVSITAAESDPEIIKGTFNGIVTETVQDDSGRTDSAFVPIEGRFRLRLLDLTE